MKGSMAVGALPLFFLAAVAAIFCADAARAIYERERLEAVAEAAALSAARVRAESLQSAAVRWASLGSMFQGVAGDDVLVAPSQWAAVEKEAQAVSQSISGYKGRIKSVVKPVVEANGLASGMVSAVLAGELGLTAQPRTVRDGAGVAKNLKAVWYRRDWAPAEAAPRATGDIRYAAAKTWAPWSARLSGAPVLWSTRAEVLAGVDWDAREGIGSDGNGGFPRSWPEALRGGVLDPHRPAVFRASLRGMGSPS